MELQYELNLVLPRVISKKSNAIYSLNVHNRTHYRAYSTIKNKYKEIYLTELEKHDKVLLLSARITYELWITSKRYIDLDNSVFCKKFLQDVLVENDYLIEDNCSVLTSNKETFGGIDKNAKESYFKVKIYGEIK